MKKIYLVFRNAGGRCTYIDDSIGEFECGHYFSVIAFRGAGFYGTDINQIEYNDITTFLTPEQFKYMVESQNTLKDFGYGIKEDSDKYNECVKIINEIRTTILSWFEAPEYKTWVEEMREEEIEAIAEELGIDEDEAEMLSNEYCEHTNGIFDRDLIGGIYDDYADLGRNYAYDVPEWLESYVDYESLGEDEFDNGYYWKLSDGRIVGFNE